MLVTFPVYVERVRGGGDMERGSVLSWGKRGGRAGVIENYWGWRRRRRLWEDEESVYLREDGCWVKVRARRDLDEQVERKAKGTQTPPIQPPPLPPPTTTTTK